MFGFFSMAGDYASRKVGRYEGNGFFISTAKVDDSSFPYETAIRHPAYNDNKIVIVENYNSREDAKAGHEKWVEKMTAKELPLSLKEVGQSDVQRLLNSFETDSERTHIRKEGEK